jgi:site-specific DNA-methyltransferase (adenine-specific)
MPKLPNIQLMQGDCLELMASIPDGSVDMVMCDLPYGATACKWDSVIPFEPLWAHYKRVCKKNAAIVLTASQPFTSALGASNLSCLRYSWVWQKENATGHLNAKRMPMKLTEDVLVFYNEQPTYNPQGTRPCNKVARKGGNGSCYGASGNEFLQTLENYPRNIIFEARDSSKVHPTQKPVALMEYLIRTYTIEGETVLDNCMGSGTTGVACVRTGRHFIGIEKDSGYFATAKKRIESEPLPLYAEAA